MLIDWFTVVAQAVNFLILVWLLKRFLYQPILNAIDAREKRIAAELADADAKKAEAQQEREEFRRKNAEFDQQHTALLNQATAEAAAERQRLFDAARNDADKLARQAAGQVAQRVSKLAGRDRAPHPGRGVCHCAQDADGSGRDESGSANGRSVCAALARAGCR